MEEKKKVMYRFLVILSLGSIVCFQAWRTLFNNFAVEQASIDSVGVGLIQSLREVPGFLSLLVVYLLLLFKEHRLAVFSLLLMGIGVTLTGFMPSLGGLIFTTLLMSIGFHYYEAVNQSLILQYFNKKETPFIMARIRRYSSLASVITAAFIFFSAKYQSYTANYIIFGLIAVIAALWALFQNPEDPQLPVQHKKLLLRKKYWLFYLLNFLVGARRQIFVVFAVFLMVKHYHYSIEAVTVLFGLNNLINYFWIGQVAKGIDRFGERNILLFEYSGMILIFLAYAFIDNYYVVGLLYILDNILFNFSMAIRTYFQKIAEPSHIAPSSAVSFTINHIAAIVVPLMGGLLWQLDYRIPFVFGAFLAFFSLAFAFFIPRSFEVPCDE